MEDNLKNKGSKIPEQKNEINIKKDVSIMKDQANTNLSDKIFYGDNKEILAVGVHDYNDYVKLKSKGLQKMENFDEQYKDFVDYIIAITHNIWEDKGIGVIYDTYSNNVIVHNASVTSYGIRDVIGGTLQTLHSFPDRRLIAQDVVWTNYGERGYLSSHKIQSVATNLGDSSFGPATGKKVNFRTVVDCAAQDNRIYEEWLVRDNLWIIKQLGFDPHEVAKRIAKATKNQTPALQSRFGMSENMEGQYFPEKYVAKDNSVGEMMLEMFSQVWSYKLINNVKKYYADNAALNFICNKRLIGHDEIQGMLVSLFASFPNAAVVLDRISCNKVESTENEYNVAVRWRIKGMHEGLGYFGAASGKPVEVVGINHYNVVNNKIVQEWMTFDGLDVLRQIYTETDDQFIKECGE
ncbi:MAG: ester cyclase [Clostridium sp.]|uniref:ester cyclase n=1 Tax=Clostridium sp. TaxID=1506 RepID=UPI002FC86358